MKEIKIIIFDNHEAFVAVLAGLLNHKINIDNVKTENFGVDRMKYTIVIGGPN